MTDKNLYVHLDTTSNSIHSKGLTLSDFAAGVPELPQNILLLDPDTALGEFEPHTGLKIIREKAQIATYLTSVPQRNNQLKWIDFKEIHFLQQLTPLEIAELLYFSHVGRQLHSPFFYKLQNNFVYFENLDGNAKVYYRHLDSFYALLAVKLQRNATEFLNRRQAFYKRRVELAPLPDELVKNLKLAFQEGILVAFSESVVADDRLTIPMFVVEDRVRETQTKRFNQADHLGSIVYELKSEAWTFQQADWELLGNLKQV